MDLECPPPFSFPSFTRRAAPSCATSVSNEQMWEPSRNHSGTLETEAGGKLHAMLLVNEREQEVKKKGCYSSPHSRAICLPAPLLSFPPPTPPPPPPTPLDGRWGDSNMETFCCFYYKRPTTQNGVLQSIEPAW